jgi:MFS family permease
MTVPEDSAFRASAGTGRPFFAERRFWLILMAQTAFGLGWSVYLILPKFFATELGADAASIGHVGAMSGFASVTTIPLVVALIDRLGRRPLFQLGCLLLIALSLGFTGVERLGALVFLLQAATGSAFVLAFNASATMITDFAPPGRLGQAIGILGAANMATNAISTIVAEQLAHSAGWRAAFQLAAAMGVLGLFISLWIRESPRQAHGSDTGESEDPKPLGPLLRVLFVAALAGAPFSAMFTFQQPYALELGAVQVSAFFAGFTLASVAVRVFFGSLGDRHGRRMLSVIAMVGYALIALATTKLQVGWLWAYGIGFGLAHGVFYPTLNALAVELAVERARGRVITLFNGAFNAGYGLSTLLWGFVAMKRGYPTLFLLAAAVSLGSAVFLVAGVNKRASLRA